MTDKPLLDVLLDLGCDINAKNFKGSTALHVIVKDKRIGCVVPLLAHGEWTKFFLPVKIV